MQKHVQLAKGHDDLRQDAVMQQFFALVNTLLQADAASAERRLRLACYRVVVFTSASGAAPLPPFGSTHPPIGGCPPHVRHTPPLPYSLGEWETVGKSLCFVVIALQYNNAACTSLQYLGFQFAVRVGPECMQE